MFLAAILTFQYFFGGIICAPVAPLIHIPSSKLPYQNQLPDGVPLQRPPELRSDPTLEDINVHGVPLQRPPELRSDPNLQDINVSSLHAVDYRHPLEMTNHPSSQDLLVFLYPEIRKPIRLVAKKLLLKKIAEAKTNGLIIDYYDLLLKLKARHFDAFNTLTSSKVGRITIFDEINGIVKTNSVAALTPILYSASSTHNIPIFTIISRYLKSDTIFVDVPHGTTAFKFSKKLLREQKRDPVWQNALQLLN